eukprot:scaffold8828_cov204-Amphora_coffeaeformis.AAC.39
MNELQYVVRVAGDCVCLHSQLSKNCSTHDGHIYKLSNHSPKDQEWEIERCGTGSSISIHEAKTTKTRATHWKLRRPKSKPNRVPMVAGSRWRRIGRQVEGVLGNRCNSRIRNDQRRSSPIKGSQGLHGILESYIHPANSFLSKRWLRNTAGYCEMITITLR